MFGYHGRYLRIDVTTASARSRVPLGEDVLRQFLGGSGLGARLLLDEGGADRGSARAGGAAGLRLQPARRQPADHLRQICRRQQEPADRSHQRLAGQQRFRDRRQALRLPTPSSSSAGRPSSRCWSSTMAPSASNRPTTLRGATCQATEATLSARLGADYRIASIGPAGERAVRYATISHDGRHAGRGGSGAVLGSKNIKAIAVRGTQRVEWAHPRELTELQPGPVEAVVRPGNRQVPRARDRDQPADVQSPRRAADAQLSERHVRAGRRPSRPRK